jgi:tetratricopeptide (TPR) repeat protein
VPEYSQGLAHSHKTLGIHLREVGKREEAGDAYREAIRIYKALADSDPARPNFRRDLAESHLRMGLLLAALGRREEAGDAFREAIQLQQALVKAHPKVPRYRHDLADSRHNLGVLFLALGKRAEAEAALREAARLYTALARAHPDVAEYRRDLARSQKALNLLGPRGADRNPERVARALALARSGDHAQAAAAAEDLVKGTTSNALFYGAARTLAVCAAAVKDDAKLRERYAARAVALLAELHEEGYFASVQNAARLKEDPDLALLRQRDDFRKLLAEGDKGP